MPLTSSELIAKLQGAGCQFTQHEHAAVMTVEAQEAALAGTSGVVIKNLFIRDKKNRLYVVSALPQTKVELNVLSARLGTGKGGVRFAPEELLPEVLRVPLGSVTPLVVANPEAKDVVLLLDKNIQQTDKVFVHPLVNTASLCMAPATLEQALRAVGREPIWVDLEADPKIDKENPPDLAKYTVAPPPPSATPPAPTAPAPPKKDSKSAAKSAAPAANNASGPSAQAAQHLLQRKLCSATDVTQQLLDMVSTTLLGGPLSSQTLDPYTVTRLTADVESLLSSFKNAAYALGYTAGKDEVVAFAQRRFA